MLLNPANEKFDYLDDESAELMFKTVEFFEKKGKKKIKDDDHNVVWYADFIEFVKENQVFAKLMTPYGYGASDSRWDTNRICAFNEILGFYGLAYWYTWQVSMLGLCPIWMSSNEKIKKETAKMLQDGHIFAFGLSEKEHGADLIASEMKLLLQPDGNYLAEGRKYYIGNANKAGFVSTFARIEGTRNYAFFVARSDHKNYNLIKNVVHSQNYVAEFELQKYPVKTDELLHLGRDAWDVSLSTVAVCKYNLGWASIGISTHAFYEAINHASNRRLFSQYVTDFPHIRQLFVEAYARLAAMRMFAERAKDYIRISSETDRRYLLYNPMVKMKVTMQGEDVINLIWDVIAAKGFEKDMMFEMCARDIRALPKLEGTAHVNMVLVVKFIQNILFKADPSIQPAPKRIDADNDDFLFKQGATTKGLGQVPFHDYKKVFAGFKIANLDVFNHQIKALQDFFTNTPPEKEQSQDLDFMLVLGEIFTLVPYATLILENAEFFKADNELLDQIFDFMIRDLNKHAVLLQAKSSVNEKQRKQIMNMIASPVFDENRYQHVWEKNVISLKDKYCLKEG